MARFRYKHIQSTVENKTPSDLLDGELAVNRFKGKEKIFLKNASGEVVSFSSDSLINKELENKTNISDFSAHTANTEIHVTSADKTTWNAKVDTSAIANFFDDAKYEDSGTTKVINFYHGNTVRSTIDATDFIKDGMIDTVSAGTSGSTTVLVITWNTDASKSQTILDIGDMFEADNYYTKSQTSGATELTTAFGGKADTATTLAGYGITDAYTKTEVDNKLGTGFTVSSITEVIESNERVTASALNDLNTNKLDVSAYTPTDLSNYYTKSETSGATELSTAFGAKVDSSTFTAHTADTTAHITAAERTSWNNAASGVTDLSGQSETIAAALVNLNTNKLDVTAYTPTDLSNYYTKSETSGATEISNALQGKSNANHNQAANTITAMTGYVTSSTVSDISTTDTLTQAMAKLEARFGGVRIVKITQADYDNLPTPRDSNTLYIITD